MTVPRSLSPRGLLVAVGIGLVLWLLCLVWLVAVARAEGQWSEDVLVTWYLPTGHVMRDGAYPYVGAAACGSYFPMGSVLSFPDGFTVVCEDTGYLGRYQVDVFAPTRQWGLGNVEAAYGRYSTVTVQRWGWDG